MRDRMTNPDFAQLAFDTAEEIQNALHYAAGCDGPIFALVEAAMPHMADRGQAICALLEAAKRFRAEANTHAETLHRAASAA